jgi:uncharacterized protein YjcR
MKKIKIDWLKAKREFLLDYSMSLKDIADKYGFSYSKIKKVSASREWFKDKKRVQNLISDALMKELEFEVKEQIIEKTKESMAANNKYYLKGKSPFYKYLFNLPKKEFGKLNTNEPNI